MINDFRVGDLIRYKDIVREKWYYGFVERVYKEIEHEQSELIIVRTEEGDTRHISHFDPEKIQLASRPK